MTRDIPGWLIVDEQGVPCVLLPTREQARQLVREIGCGKVVREEGE